MSPAPRVILDENQIKLTIDRICHQLIEYHGDFSNSVLIGIQPRGGYLSDRIKKRIDELMPNNQLKYGKIDPTFYRDDFRTKTAPITPSAMELNFVIDKHKAILVDDVFFTGRTVRAAMDALMDFGRPDKVELLVLIDRRFNRHLPIQADYIGKEIDSVISEKVIVNWEIETGIKDSVSLYESE